MKLLIRTDATTRIGTGHVMRCLALAQAWQDEGREAMFVTACDTPDLLQRLNNEGMTIVKLPKAHPNPDDWEQTAAVLADHPRARVVLDGYHFTPDYQQRVQAAGHSLLIIDDTAHMNCYHADILLNQNIGAEKLIYQTDSDTLHLLGPRYALLRREFWPWREWQRQIPTTARKVLVTLGGGDPDNQTLKVIQALQQLQFEGLEATIVVGASNPHRADLEAAIAANSTPIQLVQNVTNMPELMAWADVAVSAGGSTCWELAFMGLPHLVIILADNQQAIAEGLAEGGVAVNLGWFTDRTVVDVTLALRTLLRSDPTQRRDMSQRGRQLIDGRGGERVISYLGI